MVFLTFPRPKNYAYGVDIAYPNATSGISRNFMDFHGKPRKSLSRQAQAGTRGPHERGSPRDCASVRDAGRSSVRDAGCSSVRDAVRPSVRDAGRASVRQSRSCFFRTQLNFIAAS